MAHTKAQGAVKGNRDSISKRRGVKLFGGEKAKPGSIIIRQRGTKFLPGKNVKIGKDDTLYSVAEGFVKFSTKKIRKFDNQQRRVKVVSVE